MNHRFEISPVARDSNGQLIELLDKVSFQHPSRPEKVVFGQVTSITNISDIFPNIATALFMIICRDLTDYDDGSTESFTPMAKDVTLIDPEEVDSRVTEAKLMGTLYRG